MTTSETNFLNEMNAREQSADLFTIDGFGSVRINPNPCDPRQFIVTGMVIYILRMETTSKGKTFYGARYKTMEQAQKELIRVANKMMKASRMALK